MNKKGFTLVELMVSITLLSIVLIFMMNTLVKLRDTNVAEGVETNLVVMQALIGKEINSDILKNGGIVNIEQVNGYLILTLGFNNTTYRKLSISNDNKTLKYEVYNKGTNEAIDTLVNKTIKESSYQFESFSSVSLDDVGNESDFYIIVQKYTGIPVLTILTILVREPCNCDNEDFECQDECWNKGNNNNYDIDVLSYFPNT